ncbi:MAG: tetratricopeptide repeat protein [Acidobacteria bacterium]|nr:tetratricopeptide repeat protein [Acidobacteriota bacterium]
MKQRFLFTSLPAKRAVTAASLFAFAFIYVLPVGAQIQETANASVRVSDAANGLPLDRVKLELIKFPEGILQLTFTDGGGRAEFTQLIPQSYSIRATREGYLPAEAAFDIRRGQLSENVSIQMQPENPRQTSAAPGGLVSAKSLAAPQAAKDEFSKGVELLNQKKDARGSIPFFQHALELAPEFYDAHYVLGLAYLQLQSLDDAEKSLARALALEPKLLPPYHPLATILITRKRFDEAEKLLLRALEIDPKGWQWPFELARSQATQQKWEKALEYSKQAHAAAGVPTRIHLLMADIYSGAGQVDLAAAELDEFERLDPRSPYMPKVRQARTRLRKPTP